MALELLPYTMPETIEDDETAERVLELYAQIHPHWSLMTTHGRDLMLDELGPEQDVFVAREDDGGVVGVASYYLPRGTDKLYLSGMAVDPESHGGGVGRQMWRHLVETAIRLDKKTIEAISLGGVEDFYRKMGAVVTGDRILLEIDHQSNHELAG